MEKYNNLFLEPVHENFWRNPWGRTKEDFEKLPSGTCSICGTYYKNHIGSTPCCGAIAWNIKENDNKNYE